VLQTWGSPRAREQQVCTLPRPRSADPRLPSAVPSLVAPGQVPEGECGEGAPDFLDSFCASETNGSRPGARAASPATHGTARRHASTRFRCATRAPGMSRLPPSTGDSGWHTSAPPAPGAADKGVPGRNATLFRNLPAAHPSPKQRGCPSLHPHPPGAPALGERTPRGIVRPAGSAPQPCPSAAGTAGDRPLQEPKSRAARPGAARVQPNPDGVVAAPPSEKFAPLPARGAPALTSRRAAQLVGALRASLRPARGRRGPGAPEQPRAAPGRPRPAAAAESPRGAGAGKFRCRMAAEGAAAAAAAAAAAGRGRWRLLAPVRGEWGRWGGSGSGAGGGGRDSGGTRTGSDLCGERPRASRPQAERTARGPPSPDPPPTAPSPNAGGRGTRSPLGPSPAPWGAASQPSSPSPTRAGTPSLPPTPPGLPRHTWIPTRPLAGGRGPHPSVVAHPQPSSPHPTAKVGEGSPGFSLLRAQFLPSEGAERNSDLPPIPNPAIPLLPWGMGTRATPVGWGVGE
jgi:hypothetical protein